MAIAWIPGRDGGKGRIQYRDGLILLSCWPHQMGLFFCRKRSALGCPTHVVPEAA